MIVEPKGKYQMQRSEGEFKIEHPLEYSSEEVDKIIKI